MSISASTIVTVVSGTFLICNGIVGVHSDNYPKMGKVFIALGVLFVLAAIYLEFKT